MMYRYVPPLWCTMAFPFSRSSLFWEIEKSMHAMENISFSSLLACLHQLPGKINLMLFDDAQSSTVICPLIPLSSIPYPVCGWLSHAVYLSVVCDKIYRSLYLYRGFPMVWFNYTLY